MAQEIRSPFQTRDENDDEVIDLVDLIEARDNPTQDDATVAELQGYDEDLDIEDALTFPKPKRSRDDEEEPADLSDFDADARTSDPGDPAENEYRTRQDFVDSMNLDDPDPNVGADEGDFIGDAGIDRAPDMTGTVTGAVRGLGTHLPQDLGRDGFQIIEPEALGDPRVLDVTDDEDDMADPSMDYDKAETPEDEQFTDALAEDGGQIPVAKPDVDTRDEALDATRRIR